MGSQPMTETHVYLQSKVRNLKKKGGEMLLGRISGDLTKVEGQVVASLKKYHLIWNLKEGQEFFRNRNW